MKFLVGALFLAIPVVAAWVVFWKRMKVADSYRLLYREGAVRPWETEAEERAERRRLNAMLEEELIRRVA